MTLKQIEYFQKVIEKGNISQAAEELFVSRSVISRSIIELEEEFGAELVKRSRNGVTLTDSGKILARLFESFTVSYGAARERIRLQSEEDRMKTLHLGISPTNAYFVYKHYLENFQLLHDDIRIFIEEYGAYEGGKLLLEGKLDGFFTPARMDSSVFNTLELYQNPIMLGISTTDTKIGEKASMADLVGLPLAYYNFPMPLEHIIEAGLEALGTKPHIVLRTSDQLLLKELTRKGQVYPILPKEMMSSWSGIRMANLDFISVSSNKLSWSASLEPSPSFKKFLKYMKGLV